MAGAAEPIRWAFEQGGVEWTDKRLTREEFGALKPSEFRCVPSFRDILGIRCAVCRENMLLAKTSTFSQGT